MLFHLMQRLNTSLSCLAGSMLEGCLRGKVGGDLSIKFSSPTQQDCCKICPGKVKHCTSAGPRETEALLTPRLSQFLRAGEDKSLLCAELWLGGFCMAEMSPLKLTS